MNLEYIIVLLVIILVFVISYALTNTRGRDVTVMIEAMEKLIAESEHCRKKYEELQAENVRLKAILKFNNIKFEFEELTPHKRTKLRSAMHRIMKIEDIRTLAFDLDIDFESLRNGTTGNLIMSLIEDCERKGKIPELVSWMEENYPHWSL